jgi:alkylation response protein AidB-like acyl-CoA dehydrogenase
MKFDLSEEQQLLADSVQRFLERDYTFEKRKAVVASDAGYSPDAWKAIADLGLLALPIPTEHGGFGGTAVDVMPVMERFGGALVVEPYLSTLMCARMLCHPRPSGDARAGGDARGGGHPREGGDPILSAIAEGHLKLAFAHTEDGARYDLNHVAAKARRDGDGYVLDGVKRAVMHGPQADRLLISARTSGGIRDEAGISLFVVDAKAAGVQMSAYRTIDELRAADVALRNVRIPASSLVGTEGEAFEIIDDGVDYATALLCAEAVGAMKFANETTLDYLKTRKQFGVPIGHFQALQHRMVQMVIEAEQARSMASLACAGVANANRNARNAIVSAAKVRISAAARAVSQESVQLHGGMGMTEELKVSHAFRRLTAIRGAFGDEDTHLERMARAG